MRLARFWLFRGFEAAPYNVFYFHESRARDGPSEFLRDFRGTVKVDAYGVNQGVYLGSGGRIIASCCLAHARRKFDEAKCRTRAVGRGVGLLSSSCMTSKTARDDFCPRSVRALAAARGRAAAWTGCARGSTQQASTSLPKLKLGEAVGYARNQWAALVNYVDDGRLPIDNNDVERDLRALTIGRKNWLFIGSPEAGPRAAVLYTVVASAARHDLDVWAYLRDVLERLAELDAVGWMHHPCPSNSRRCCPTCGPSRIPSRYATIGSTNEKAAPPHNAPAAKNAELLAQAQAARQTNG